ncbi:hypothetical protein [Streptomyces chartreusis]|uniref:hypothetical protein n=1 Tax=Streptomyces chartreusis TaxID=1969 RepID=UPI003443407D
MSETTERLRVPGNLYCGLAPGERPGRFWAVAEPFARSASGKIMRVDPARVVLLKGGSDD